LRPDRHLSQYGIVSELTASMPPGAVIAGRYQVVDVVGTGGSATVYRVVKVGSRDELALKLMHAEHPDSETERRRFAREAEVVKQLLHPNVVPLLDYGHREDGTPFLVFALLRGRTLEAKLHDEGALTWATTARLSIGVLRALEKAHGLGIVHRDIKPGNVFLVDRPLGEIPQVVDFGLAKVVGEPEHIDPRAAKGEVIVGTPRYMAPEQVRGGRLGHEVDIYALGLVMGEMLVGKPLVDGKTDVDIYVAQGSDRPIELPQLILASPFGPIIQRAVNKDVQVRYRLASQMLADLQAAIAQVGMVADDEDEEDDEDEDMVATAFLDPEAAAALLEASPHSQRMRDAMNLAAARADEAQADAAPASHRLKAEPVVEPPQDEPPDVQLDIDEDELDAVLGRGSMPSVPEPPPSFDDELDAVLGRGSMPSVPDPQPPHEPRPRPMAVSAPRIARGPDASGPISAAKPSSGGGQTLLWVLLGLVVVLILAGIGFGVWLLRGQKAADGRNGGAGSRVMQES